MDYYKSLKYLDLENSNIFKCYQDHIKLKILSNSVFIWPLEQGSTHRLVQELPGLPDEGDSCRRCRPFGIVCFKSSFEYVIGIKYNWSQLILKPPKIRFELSKIKFTLSQNPPIFDQNAVLDQIGQNIINNKLTRIALFL